MIKKILGMTAVVAALIFTPSIAKAQKTAYVYLDSILIKMPDALKADSALMKYREKLAGELEKVSGDCQAKIEAYQQNETLDPTHPQKWTKSKKQLMEEEIRNCQTNAQTFTEDAERSLQEKRVELMKPVFDRAKKAVDDVAKEKGYTLVINASGGMIIYSLPSDDLTAAVMKKLNLK